MAPVMASLDILVQPSRRETFGRTLIEAMATRKPVIASRVGGMPEVVTDQESGLLVPEEDPQKLAAAMIARTSRCSGCLWSETCNAMA